jgi:hypothetical protein
VFEADMTSFSLPERYDVVLCLFSSIGYVKTLDHVQRTLEQFRAHLAPGGVIIVEPWFPPGVLTHGRTSVNVAESPDVKVCRMVRTEVDGRLSRLYFEYLIGRTSGLEHRALTELFTRDANEGRIEIETIYVEIVDLVQQTGMLGGPAGDVEDCRRMRMHAPDQARELGGLAGIVLERGVDEVIQVSRRGEH